MRTWMWCLGVLALAGCPADGDDGGDVDAALTDGGGGGGEGGMGGVGGVGGVGGMGGDGGMGGTPACGPDDCGPMPPGLNCPDGTMIGPTCAPAPGGCDWDFPACPGEPCDAGDTCDPTAFCDYDADCGFDDGSGVCRPRPDTCPEVFSPVCGCDGVTYDNDCIAQGAGSDVFHPGPCEVDCTPADCGPLPPVVPEPCPDGTPREFICGRDPEGLCSYTVTECPAECAPEECPDAAAPGPCPDGTPRELICSRGDDGICRQLLGPCPGDACGLPADSGECDGIVPRWYHNAATGQCEEFTYGGCGGNANNFETLEACQAACGGDICGLPAVVGPCEAEIPRWYHNAATGQCEEFIYGGCQGNANNFETQAACEGLCGGGGGGCGLPADSGPCAAAFQRWFYNAATGLCEEFVWGGCGGNANNYETLEACLSTCLGDVCGLPAAVGDCDAAIPRWYHNDATGQCEEFIWGGCGGNANNFETRAACEGSCGGDMCEASLDTLFTGGRWVAGECIGDCRQILQLTPADDEACDGIELGLCDDAQGICQTNQGRLTPLGNNEARALARALIGVEVPAVSFCEVQPCIEDLPGISLFLRREGRESEHAYESGRPPATLVGANAWFEDIREALRTCRATARVQPAPGCQAH